MDKKRILIEVPLDIALFKGVKENSVSLEIRSALVEYDAMTPMLWCLNHVLKAIPAGVLSKERDLETKQLITKTLPVTESLARRIRKEMLDVACMSTTIH